MSTLLTPYPWQAQQWQQLQQLRGLGRLPHALLLAGPDGIGKLRFARALAQQLVCAQPQETGACGRCSDCQLLAAGTHPDFRQIEPAEGKRQILVEQVRELVDYCTQTAYRQGGRKLALIAPAEAMNTSTANALLKTLEEPAGDTVLLLVTHAPSQLLPTVRSRCLAFTFPLPREADALAWLAPQIGDATAREHHLREAGGKPLAALALYNDEGLRLREECDALMSSVASGQLNAVEAAEKLQEQPAVFVMDWLALRLGAMARAALTGLREGIPAAWSAAAANVPPSELYQLLQRVLESRAQIRRGVAINQRLLLESLLLEWVALTVDR